MHNNSDSASKNVEEHQHVKFNIIEEEFKGHHNNLEIIRNDEHLFYIDVGYLKAHHHYKMAFDFNFKFENLIYSKDKSSPNIILEEIKKRNDGTWHLVFIHLVNKETIGSDKVYFGLCDKNPAKQIEIHFEARVLGEDQGTPSLRNGITLMHHHNHPHAHQIHPFSQPQKVHQIC